MVSVLEQLLWCIEFWRCRQLKCVNLLYQVAFLSPYQSTACQFLQLKQISLFKNRTRWNARSKNMSELNISLLISCFWFMQKKINIRVGERVTNPDMTWPTEALSFPCQKDVFFFIIFLGSCKHSRWQLTKAFSPFLLQSQKEKSLQAITPSSFFFSFSFL